ncbi:MAG: hypothetical protein V3T83_12060 [Acidobacteriota bacterium]
MHVVQTPGVGLLLSARVIRGGGWGGPRQYCRSADRDGYGPGDRLNSLGFRLLRQAR